MPILSGVMERRTGSLNILFISSVLIKVSSIPSSTVEYYTGEFIAFSKSYDPWIFHLDIGRINIDKTGWKSHNYWGIGGMYLHQQEDMEYGLSIEVCGREKIHSDSGERLAAIIGLSGHPQGSNAVSQIGFQIPMDGSGQRWGLLLSVSFLF